MLLNIQFIIKKYKEDTMNKQTKVLMWAISILTIMLTITMFMLKAEVDNREVNLIKDFTDKYEKVDDAQQVLDKNLNDRVNKSLDNISNINTTLNKRIDSTDTYIKNILKELEDLNEDLNIIYKSFDNYVAEVDDKLYSLSSSINSLETMNDIQIDRLKEDIKKLREDNKTKNDSLWLFLEKYGTRKMYNQVHPKKPKKFLFFF